MFCGSRAVDIDMRKLFIPAFLLALTFALQGWGQVQMDRVNATGVNGVINATRFQGSDIGTQVNAAFASTICNNSCTVQIPANTYNNDLTTINFPMFSNGKAALWIDKGATINYTGTGYAIDFAGTGQSNVGARVYGGGAIIGTSSGIAGIHLRAFNKAQFYDLSISGFSNTDGWLNEGANTIDCFSCEFDHNKNGVHQKGVTVNSINYSANAVHFYGLQVWANTGWCIYEDGTTAGTTGPNQKNKYDGVVYQACGSNANPGTSGLAFIQRCDNCELAGGYFEGFVGETRTSLVQLGDSSSSCGGANSCYFRWGSVHDNWFGGQTTTTNTINCVNCSQLGFHDNVDVGAPTNFFNNGSLSTAIMWGINNLAPSAGTYITGTGTFAWEYNAVTGATSTNGNYIASNFVFSNNTAQGTFFSGIDTVVRSATGGHVFLQDQLGTNMETCTTSSCVFPSTVIAPTHALNSNLTWTSGAGVPSAGSCTAVNGGSLYSRTDGTTTTTLYVCDNSTHVWTAK